LSSRFHGGKDLWANFRKEKKKSVENWEELPVKAQSVDFDDVENFQEGQNKQTLNEYCVEEKKQFRGEKMKREDVGRLEPVEKKGDLQEW
jgi:hypothetical protein